MNPTTKKRMLSPTRLPDCTSCPWGVSGSAMSCSFQGLIDNIAGRSHRGSPVTAISRDRTAKEHLPAPGRRGPRAGNAGRAQKRPEMEGMEKNNMRNTGKQDDSGRTSPGSIILTRKICRRILKHSVLLNRRCVLQMRAHEGTRVEHIRRNQEERKNENQPTGSHADGVSVLFVRRVQ